MGKIFSIDSSFMRGLSRLADMMMLNLLVLLCCIPVFTAGAALSSMYYIELKWVRKEEGYLVKPFFQQFKANFIQATGEWLIMLLLTGVLVLDFVMFRYVPDTFPKAVKYLVVSVTVLIYLLLQWVFPLQSHFINKVKVTFKNSVLFAIANFPRTLGMGAIWLVFAALTVVSMLFIPRLFPIMLVFGFTAPGYVVCMLVSKPFNRFEPEKVEITLEESEEEKEAAYEYLNEKLSE